jgi:hypothetical protein
MSVAATLIAVAALVCFAAGGVLIELSLSSPSDMAALGYNFAAVPIALGIALLSLALFVRRRSSP